MPYEPPSGYKVGLTFVNGFEIPPGYRVGLEFVPGDRPVGDAQYLFPTGSESLVVGMASFALHHHFIPLQGIRAGDVGRHVLESTTKEIKLGGIYPPQQSTRHFVENLLQILPLRGVVPGAVGRPLVTNWYQWVRPTGLPHRNRFGGTRATYRDGKISAKGIQNPPLGYHTVWMLQGVEAAGFTSSVVGSRLRVDINLQKVDVRSIPGGSVIGDLHAGNWNSYINTRTLGEQIVVAKPTIYNFDQVVVLPPTKDPENFHHLFLNKIELRDRNVRPSGFLSQRFAIFPAHTWNFAAPIIPRGVYPGVVDSPRVEFFNREVLPTGWSSSYSSKYTHLWNKARVVAPVSIRPTLNYSVPHLENRNKQIKTLYSREQTVYGKAFIAYAIRTLHHRGYIYPYVPVPEIRLNPYPITPKGWESTGRWPAAPRFSVRRLEAFPHSVHNRLFGHARVVNRNMSIYPYGLDAAEFSRLTKIENFISELVAEGRDMSIIPRHMVGRRDRTITLKSIDQPGITRTHKIYNKENWVLPTNRSINDVTIPPPYDSLDPGLALYGRPTIVERRIRISGIRPVGVGSPSMRDNIIPTESIDFSEVFGRLDVTNSTRFVACRGFFNIEQLSEAGNRLSPNYIYAPEGTEGPQGYLPRSDFATIVDEQKHKFGWYGHPRVRNLTGDFRVFPRGFANSVVSRFAAVAQKLRYVLPKGIRGFRSNTPEIDGGFRYIFIDGISAPFMGVPPGGQKPHKISHIYVPYEGPIKPPSIRPTTPVGRARIESTIRDVYPRGATPGRQVSDPMVGFHREIKGRGWDSSLWGAAWVSLAIREVAPVGRDMNGFNIDEPPFNFYQMFVRNASLGVSKILTPSIYSGGVGKAVVTNKEQFVWQGVTYGFAVPRAILSYRVATISFGGEEFGNIRRFIDGVIQTDGIPPTGVGESQTSYRLPAGGIAAGGAGDGYVYPAVAVSGIYRSSVPTPSMINSGDCYVKVVANVNIPHPGGLGKPWIKN